MGMGATRAVARSLALGLAAHAAVATAAERVLGAAAACTVAAGESGQVVGVRPGAVLELAGGLAVRLAAIDIPAGAAGMAALQQVAAGQVARLGYGGPRRDRYGRAIAQVYLADGLWLQKALVESGEAFVAGSADDRSCLGELLAAERVARAGRLGLWSRAPVALRAADDPSLRAADGLYGLVEGRIASVGRRTRTVYLDFGRDWATDLTVSMSAATAAEAEAGGSPLESLIGRSVRVRGWLTQRDGPWIRVDHPEQIEVLDQ